MSRNGNYSFYLHVLEHACWLFHERWPLTSNFEIVSLFFTRTFLQAKLVLRKCEQLCFHTVNRVNGSKIFIVFLLWIIGFLLRKICTLTPRTGKPELINCFKNKQWWVGTKCKVPSRERNFQLLLPESSKLGFFFYELMSSSSKSC